MRLICPNCAAQYEVDDSAIPEAGRDVQCSNCQHAWFQMPSPPEDPPEPVGQEEGSDEAAAAAGRVAGRPAYAAQGPASGTASAASDEPSGTDEEKIPADAPPDDQDATEPGYSEDDTSDHAQRRGLDDSIVRVLREEAEREARARRAEAAALETQPDLGLDVRPARPVIHRVPQSVKDDGHAQDVSAAQKGQVPEGQTSGPLDRRHRLPDIEEINSTLRPTSQRDQDATGAYAEEAEPERTRRQFGFRLGFLLVLTLGLGLLMVYAYAAMIAESVPQTGPWLSAYVEVVDRLRMALETNIDAAIRALTNLITGGSGD